MTLYRQVPSKDGLVGAMVETVLAEYRPDHGISGWRARLEYEAHEELALYQRHPWLLTVVGTTRPPIGPGLLATVDRPTRALIGHGVDHQLAAWVYLVVSSYVQGAALLIAAERDAVRDTGVSFEHWYSKRLGHLVGTLGSRYQWLSAPLGAEQGHTDALDLDAWFEFGLDRVLDGVAMHLADPPDRS